MKRTRIPLRIIASTAVAVGTTRDGYYYETSDGLKNVFRSLERFRYALRNEAQVLDADTTIKHVLEAAS